MSTSRQSNNTLEVAPAPEPMHASGFHRQIAGLFGANVLTLAIIGLSFLAYSKLLSPAEFGLYALALSATSLLTLVLDGGLKTSIIKLKAEFPKDEEASVALIMLLVSFVLIVLLLVAGKTILLRHRELKQDMKFISLYVGIALVSYPFVALPTAILERKLRYGHIAWIESVGMMLERAFPAILLLWTSLGLYSFVAAVFLSRFFRIAVLMSFHRVRLSAISKAGMKQSFALLKEGAWIQCGTISSVVRDNLHVLLVGPLFGKVWIGYYAWAYQICLISSQIFAQISARVSLPVLAQADDFEDRWPKCLYQIRLLAILTIPVLCAVWLILPAVNNHMFQGKWSLAVTLIPLLFLRMIPGIATTPIGPLVMVHRGGMTYAKVNIIWTVLEAAGASVLLIVIGPRGLAWSCAFIVWIGLWLMVHSLRGKTGSLARDIIAQLFKRPSVAFVLCGSALFVLASSRATSTQPFSLIPFMIAAALVLLSYLAEPELRKLLVHE